MIDEESIRQSAAKIMNEWERRIEEYFATLEAVRKHVQVVAKLRWPEAGKGTIRIVTDEIFKKVRQEKGIKDLSDIPSEFITMVQGNSSEEVGEAKTSSVANFIKHNQELLNKDILSKIINNGVYLNGPLSDMINTPHDAPITFKKYPPITTSEDDII